MSRDTFRQPLQSYISFTHSNHVPSNTYCDVIQGQPNLATPAFRIQHPPRVSMYTITDVIITKDAGVLSVKWQYHLHDMPSTEVSLALRFGILPVMDEASDDAGKLPIDGW